MAEWILRSVGGKYPGAHNVIIDADAAVLVDPLFQAVSQRPQSAENAIFPRPGTGEHRDSDLRSAQLTGSITCKPETTLSGRADPKQL